jgi:hypothetical protein
LVVFSPEELGESVRGLIVVMNRKALASLGVAGAVLLPALAIAAFDIPNSFTAGTVISSSKVNRNFEAVADELTALQNRVAALEAPPVWKGAELLSGWANNGSPYETVGFWKAPQGIVHMKGVLHIDSSSDADLTKSLMFQLPEGHRPARLTVVGVIHVGNELGRLDIKADGQVNLNLAAGVANTKFWVSLDNITFPAAQ